jgi:hypothetical protein
MPLACCRATIFSRSTTVRRRDDTPQATTKAAFGLLETAGPGTRREALLR